MEEFKEVFHEFDIDGDGTISIQVWEQNVLIKYSDIDWDGSILIHEFKFVIKTSNEPLETIFLCKSVKVCIHIIQHTYVYILIKHSDRAWDHTRGYFEHFENCENF